jgi:hypothetical protein
LFSNFVDEKIGDYKKDTLPQGPRPSGLAMSQLCVRPHGSTPRGIPASWAPCPSVPAGPQFCVGLLDPCSTWFPTPWAPPGPSSTGLPESCSSRPLLGRLPQEGSKPA